MVGLAWQDPVPGLSPGVLPWKQPPVPESLEAVGVGGGWQWVSLFGSRSGTGGVLPTSELFLVDGHMEAQSIQVQSGGTSSWL